MPPGFDHGVTWDEDLLFVEPETVCVDTNLTLDYKISSVNMTYSNQINITDRGGFVNIGHELPQYLFNNTQANPQLYERAFLAAWLQNYYTMLFLNITNPRNESAGTPRMQRIDSAMNKSIPVAANDLGGHDWDSLAITTDFGSYMGKTFGSIFGSSTNSSADKNVNPYKIGTDNMTDISMHSTTLSTLKEIADSENRDVL